MSMTKPWAKWDEEEKNNIEKLWAIVTTSENFGDFFSCFWFIYLEPRGEVLGDWGAIFRLFIWWKFLEVAVEGDLIKEQGVALNKFTN